MGPVIQSFTCATTHQTGRVLEDREVWIFLRFVSIVIMLQKEKILYLNLLKTRLRCGRSHFFATLVDLKKKLRISRIFSPTFLLRVGSMSAPGVLQKKQMDFWWQKPRPKRTAKKRPTFWTAIFGRQSNFCSARSTAPTSEVSGKASNFLDLAGSTVCSWPPPKEASPKLLSMTQFPSPVWHSARISSRCSPQNSSTGPAMSPYQVRRNGQSVAKRFSCGVWRRPRRAQST